VDHVRDLRVGRGDFARAADVLDRRKVAGLELPQGGDEVGQGVRIGEVLADRLPGFDLALELVEFPVQGLEAEGEFGGDLELLKLRGGQGLQDRQIAFDLLQSAADGVLALLKIERIGGDPLDLVEFLAEARAAGLAFAEQPGLPLIAAIDQTILDIRREVRGDGLLKSLRFGEVLEILFGRELDEAVLALLEEPWPRRRSGWGWRAG
jgi:hypothetical protein